MKAVGWLLDAHINGEESVLWIKSDRGDAIRLVDRYTPDFYVEPMERVRPEELTNALLKHPNVLRVLVEKKFTTVHMKGKAMVLHVYVDRTKNFLRVLMDLERLSLIKGHFNTDLLHVQRYLFQKGVAPTNKVEVDYDDGGRLLYIRVLDDCLELKPPPFTKLIFDIEVKSQGFTPQVEKDPISKITVFDEMFNLKEGFYGDEKRILTNFSDYVKRKDPDFLISPQVESVLKYILERAKNLELKIQLGREEININELARLVPYAHKGRVHLNLHTFLEIGVAGVIERSRFTLAPPGLSAKWSAGRTIDSRQCFEATKRGILLPKDRGLFKYVATAKETIFRDRGGLVLSPKVGLHENVAELDYESMYPNIIIKHNVSYETVKQRYLDKGKRGFLGELTGEVLERRLHFKHLRQKYPVGSQERLWCEQRQLALKGILVCIYGYSGCFANRFNNVSAYEEINKISRKILVKTMNTAMSEGFEVIYADSDSLFVKKEGADEESYRRLANTISKATNIPMALDHHYKFLVLLTQEPDPNLEATRRYFGKLVNGELYYRGIELRRHDCPPFLKEFQAKLMEILFDAKCAGDVKKNQFREAYNYVVWTCDKIREGKIELKKLVVSKVLRKAIKEYRSMFPHVITAIQMLQNGKNVRRGEIIDFLYVNAEHRNPFRRVVPAQILNGNHYYDRDKYLNMALDTAETILGVFGFSSKDLGVTSKPKNFFQEVWTERNNEFVEEFQSLKRKNMKK